MSGAAAGIGARIAADLVRRGWRVACLDRHWPADAPGLADSLGPGEPRSVADESLRLTADLTSPEQVAAAVADLCQVWDGLDALVNNAAYGPPRAPIADQSVEDLAALFDINVIGQFRLVQATRELLARGDRPAIVNLSSVGAQRAFRGLSAYSSAKGAIEALTRALALDLAPLGIRVNAVSPAMVVTERWAGTPADRLAQRAAIVPLGRPGEPEEIAAAVAFLAGTESSYVTGAVLPVDGGLSIQAYSPADERGL